MIIGFIFVISSVCLVATANDLVDPTVTIVFFVRNKAHVLPHFLALIENLDYPKDRISIYVRTDHNEDSSAKIIRTWTDKLVEEGLYHSVNATIETSELRFPDEENAVHVSDMRIDHMIDIKEEALNVARRQWSDFIWFVDCDAMITYNQTLKHMVQLGHTVSAPMLKAVGLYSNFWADMTETYYYKRNDEYVSILNRKEKSCHSVKNIYSAILIDLRRRESRHLSFKPWLQMIDYDGPTDDLITFPLSAQKNNVPLYICNDFKYGFITNPLEDEQDLKYDRTTNLLNLKLEVLVENDPLPYLPEFEDFTATVLPRKTSLGVDKIYLINLERRPDRKRRMDLCFDLLGIEAEWVKAVDGKQMTPEFVEKHGIKMLPTFQEPYNKRALKYGEIGCFMSHYNIWLDIIKNGYKEAIIFEDDIRFEPLFNDKLQLVRQELKDLSLDWDLLYLGRKILFNSHEDFVKNSKFIVEPDYTYWTLSYMITLEGAKKLVDEEPLSKMVPVDEYLPIMYGRHWNSSWSYHYKNRIKAFSAEPRLVHPTHYTGEEGYISDTEWTPIVETFKKELQKLDIINFSSAEKSEL